MTDQIERLQDPETIRLHMGELTASEMRVAQAAIRYALAGVGGVSVEKLDSLCRKWDAASVRNYGQKSSHAGDLRRLLADHGVTYVIGGDLSAILSRGG